MSRVATVLGTSNNLFTSDLFYTTVSLDSLFLYFSRIIFVKVKKSSIYPFFTIQRSQQVISIMGQIQEKYFNDTFKYRHVVLPPEVNTHGEEEDGKSVKIRMRAIYSLWLERKQTF
nr:hypothetical protein [Tanacetum cinerariifolium]